MSFISYLSKLKADGGIIFGNEVTELNPNPVIGESCIFNGMLCVYLNYMGASTWYPLIKVDKIFVYEQTTPSSNWLITHNKNTVDFKATLMVGGKVHGAEIEIIDANSFRVKPGILATGKVVVLFDIDTGTDPVASPYPVDGTITETGEFVLTLSTTETVSLGQFNLNTSDLDSIVKNYIGLTNGEVRTLTYQTADPSILRKATVYRLVGGNGETTSIYADYLADESTNYQAPANFTIDGVVSIDQFYEKQLASYVTNTTNGAVFSSIVDFNEFDGLVSMTMS